MIIGYTTGVFDLFHIGHVNLLRNAKSLCDKLIVGVTVDELVAYKNKRAVIPFAERIEVVKACRYVDTVVSQETLDKFEVWKKLKFDIMFVGDDWYRSERWRKLENSFSEVGVRVVFFPYTKGTSSTTVNETLARLRNDAQ